MDGVSGLNVFTGINQNVSQVSYLESKAINPVPDGRQLSAPQVMLSAPGFGERNCEYIKGKVGRNRFLEKNAMTDCGLSRNHEVAETRARISDLSLSKDGWLRGLRTEGARKRN